MSIKNKSTAVIAVVVMISMLFNYYLNRTAEPGTQVSEAKLINDLGKIGNNEVKVRNEYIGMIDDLLKDKGPKILSNQMEAGSRYIEVSVQKKKEFSNPLEIRYGIRVWLYLMNHKLPYPITAVRILIDEKWVNDKQYSALIHKEEFQRLYSEISVVGQIDENEIVGKLTDLWLTQNNYQRRNLK